MSWEITGAPSNSVPPYQLFTATSGNVDSWLEEVLTFPAGDELGFRRRFVQYISLRATNAPASVQLTAEHNLATYCFLSRLGKAVTPHVITRLFLTGANTGNAETLPLCWWTNPFALPARGGDTLTVLVPGDSDATPVQDWELNVALGVELR